MRWALLEAALVGATVLNSRAVVGIASSNLLSGTLSVQIRILVRGLALAGLLNSWIAELYWALLLLSTVAVAAQGSARSARLRLGCFRLVSPFV